MTTCTVSFSPAARVMRPVGTLIIDAARQAGIDLNIPCGGQGRCGRCAVVVRERRSPPAALDPAAFGGRHRGRLCAGLPDRGRRRCRRSPSRRRKDRAPPDQRQDGAGRSSFPSPTSRRRQPLRAFFLELDPPSLADQTDDWSRLQRCAAPQNWRRAGLPSTCHAAQAGRSAARGGLEGDCRRRDRTRGSGRTARRG